MTTPTGPGCCFPPPGELIEMAEAARAGHRRVPHVGDGSPDTLISCEHGQWRLGDLIEPPRWCAQPGCEALADKNRRWCATHKTPANRTEASGVQEDGGEGEEDGGEDEGEPVQPEGQVVAEDHGPAQVHVDNVPAAEGVTS